MEPEKLPEEVEARVNDYLAAMVYADSTEAARTAVAKIRQDMNTAILLALAAARKAGMDEEREACAMECSGYLHALKNDAEHGADVELLLAVEDCVKLIRARSQEDAKP